MSECKIHWSSRSINTWLNWGIPKEKTIIVKPGDEVKVEDVTIVALEAFDRTALVTCEDPEETLKGKIPQEMDEIV